MEVYKVKVSQKNQRIDKVLVSYMPDFSRSYIAKIIDEDKCFVNDKIVKASYKVNVGDEIKIDIPCNSELNVEKEDIPLDIVYEDQDILIINKPQGLVVHPAAGHHNGTLVNAILNHCTDLSGINGVLRPGIVHRIDKDTSGLICVAKNDFAHRALAEQLKDHSMAREYIALVRGVIKENKGTISMPIARHKGDRKKMAVDKDGKEAITHFIVLERFTNHTLISCQLVTGRTHQIRVHMAEIGYPVEGDTTYIKKTGAQLYKNGQLLTAYKLKLTHPRINKIMEFEIELPDYFKDIIKTLNK